MFPNAPCWGVTLHSDNLWLGRNRKRNRGGGGGENREECNQLRKPQERGRREDEWHEGEPELEASLYRDPISTVLIIHTSSDFSYQQTGNSSLVRTFFFTPLLSLPWDEPLVASAEVEGDVGKGRKDASYAAPSFPPFICLSSLVPSP